MWRADKASHVVVAIVDGERSLKRRTLGARPNLAFVNGRMLAYELPEIVDVEICGVVTWACTG